MILNSVPGILGEDHLASNYSVQRTALRAAADAERYAALKLISG
jgi:hypothetical protein